MNVFAVPAAFVVCWLTLAWLLRRGGRLPMDHPNARSLHATPTPRVGGLGIMAGMGVAIPALFGYNYILSRVKDVTSDMHVFIDEFVTKAAEYYSPGGASPRVRAATQAQPATVEEGH